MLWSGGLAVELLSTDEDGEAIDVVEERGAGVPWKDPQPALTLAEVHSGRGSVGETTAEGACPTSQTATK